MCAVATAPGGSWGGPRPSLAAYCRDDRAQGRGDRRREGAKVGFAPAALILLVATGMPRLAMVEDRLSTRGNEPSRTAGCKEL
jgi:hypothetical protein